MIIYISADFIFPITSAPIKNGVLSLKDDGTILAVLKPEDAKDIVKVKHYKGVIVPGFINTHCHLELSHLKNKVEQKTGLPNFIKQILALRQQPEEEIIRAMVKADQEMYQNGIVAVGDISNILISKNVKLKSTIYYHTFVEVFNFGRPAAPVIAQGLQLKKDFSPLKASIVPHAPYSVSADLFKEIKLNAQNDDILTIHNQETLGENELFESGSGAFAEFFKEIGIAQSNAHNSGKNSLTYHLPQLNHKINTLLVHNTFTSKADVAFAHKQHQQLYWCLCPSANIYIENTLPDVAVLKDADVNLTLGTDSLASNHQLNILAEMIVLQDETQIGFEESIKWATLNGAKFLGIDDQYGSLEVAKKPGIVLLEFDKDELLKKETKIKRLF